MSEKQRREMKAYATEILEAADEAIQFLRKDEETPHRRILEWLVS